MKTTLNRQAKLPSNQDNTGSSEQKSQQLDREPSIFPGSRKHQAALTTRASRADTPAANDESREELRLTLIPIAQVIKRTSIGRTTIYQLIRQREFPAPVKVCGASRWVLGEVTDWIESLMLKR